MMMSRQINATEHRVHRGEQRGALRFGTNSLEEKSTSLQACQWCQTTVLAAAIKLIPSTAHPSLATLQKGARHFGCIPVERKRKWWVPQRAKEVTADQRDCQWPQGRVGWSQYVRTPTPNKKIKKNLSLCQWGEVEVGVRGSGWWWVPDWGTSGDFWRGRAMHHVSCYQP